MKIEADTDKILDLMRKRGIKCAKEEEIRIWGKKGPDGKPECSDGGCSSCGSDCR